MYRSQYLHQILVLLDKRVVPTGLAPQSHPVSMCVLRKGRSVLTGWGVLTGFSFPLHVKRVTALSTLWKADLPVALSSDTIEAGLITHNTVNNTAVKQHLCLGNAIFCMWGQEMPESVDNSKSRPLTSISILSLLSSRFTGGHWTLNSTRIRQIIFSLQGEQEGGGCQDEKEMRMDQDDNRELK